MEQLNVFIADFAEDLLNFQWIQIFVQILQAFFNVRVHIATMFKLFDKVINFLVFCYGELIVHYFERLAWLFLYNSIVSSTL